MKRKLQNFQGTLIGTAVGDSLGLPYEGMSRERVRTFGEVRHRLVLGRGMSVMTRSTR